MWATLLLIFVVIFGLVLVCQWCGVWGGDLPQYKNNKKIKIMTGFGRFVKSF